MRLCTVVRRGILPLLLLGCSTVTLSADGSAAEIVVIPHDLYVYGLERSCYQVQDFYTTSPEARDPPFLFGLRVRRLSTSLEVALQSDWYDDVSAAFWCRTSTDVELGTFTLLLRQGDANTPMSACPDRIPSQQVLGGLSRVDLLEQPLSQFLDAVTLRPYDGHSTAQFSGPGIVSSDGDTATLYVCHDGRWMLASFD